MVDMKEHTERSRNERMLESAIEATLLYLECAVAKVDALPMSHPYIDSNGVVHRRTVNPLEQTNGKRI